ncbi:hypothetical protein TNIN_414891 [Trichonephila inaurata madagascariensis]|uniref:Uncharacterized protein n=1 Tax=Trichonephila inaurata madagascariensis TaxID=2747483 RepID=A0A8X6XS60_9ARAC|nr:hypothetical protein TNIN_414891 [Trichonephila inaurata madagascariensis]
MSDSESDMDLNSEKSGCTNKSHSQTNSRKPTDVYISLLAQRRQEKETLVRELQILPLFTGLDYPDHSSTAQAESDEIRL